MSNRMEDIFKLLGMSKQPDLPEPLGEPVIAEPNPDGTIPDYGDEHFGVHSSWFHGEDLPGLIEKLENLTKEMTEGKMSLLLRQEASECVGRTIAQIKMIHMHPYEYVKSMLKDVDLDKEDDLKAFASICQFAAIGMLLTLCNAAMFAERNQEDALRRIDEYQQNKDKEKEQTDNN